jgi:hypothetical protein
MFPATDGWIIIHALIKVDDDDVLDYISIEQDRQLNLEWRILFFFPPYYNKTVDYFDVMIHDAIRVPTPVPVYSVARYRDIRNKHLFHAYIKVYIK